MTNFLEPLVDSLFDAGVLVLKGVPKAWDMWGNLVYRLVEGKPYEGEYKVEDINKINYKFYPIEEIKEANNIIDYKFMEGDKEGLKACVGLDLDDKPVWVNMLESHLLIAGMSRWGKSNILNVLLTGFMLSYTPNEVGFLLCDFKNADLKQFERYKHVRGKVSTDKKAFLEQIDRIEKEANKRAKILSDADCLNAIKYNKTHHTKLSYIIFVIDELVQVTIDKTCREKLHTIMSKCASYGIYFILASQDCTKEVIGRCKMNVSHTIGVHTRDKSDSDMIIKNAELEDIRVVGRAKYDCKDLIEFQSFYISEEQIKTYLSIFLKEKYNQKEMKI